MGFSIGGGRQEPTPAGASVVVLHPRHQPASALNPWTNNTQQLAKMAKMKKGKAHHWYKEEKDKVPKKSYVPTGENPH